MNIVPEKYYVYIDDNSWYMEEPSRRLHAVYNSHEEASRACRIIVEDSIRELFDYNYTEEENYRLYQIYGLSPWFDSKDEGKLFNAGDYARAHIKNLIDLKCFLD